MIGLLVFKVTFNNYISCQSIIAALYSIEVDIKLCCITMFYLILKLDKFNGLPQCYIYSHKHIYRQEKPMGNPNVYKLSYMLIAMLS